MSSAVEYYCVRRVNPYLGVIQVIDTGLVRAYSTGINAWRPRRVYDTERYWSDEMVAGEIPVAETVSRADMCQLINRHPVLPFPPGDRYELWLLRKSTDMPLALLKTCRWERDMGSVENPSWTAFPAGEQGFNRRAHGGETVMSFGIAYGDQERLQTLVNYAAKPQPAAQWFRRHANGSATGLKGLRIGNRLVGRVLDREQFPELLVDETWDSADEAALVKAFHDWNACWLLAHHGLREDTRRRLEAAAFRNPERLLDTRHVLPEVLDREGLQVATVAAQLIRSAGPKR